MKPYILITLLFIALLQVCQESVAAPWIEIHGLSKHSKDFEYQERNYGMGVMYPLDQYIEVGFGGYRNSYNKTSLYTGFDLHTDARVGIRYGVSVGYVTGYQNTPSPTRMMVLPNLTLGNQHVRLKFGVIPMGEVKVVTLTAGFKF